MLIECQSCATRYRVDPERLPQRKTFVRCKTCGTPIYLDPTLEGGDAAEPVPGAPFASSASQGASAGTAGGLASHDARGGQGGFIPSPESGSFAEEASHPPQDGVSVQCPQCQSRYRVPLAPLQRPNIKLKCSVCGHIFAPVQAAMGAVPEERMDTLFDDLHTPGPGPEGAGLTDSAVNRLQGHTETEPYPPHTATDPELAYLDAVALDEDEIRGVRAAKVPEAQKYQLFLKPDQFRPQREAAEPEVPQVTPPAASASTDARTPGDRAPQAAPASPKAVWPEHGGDDDFLEIEFFDDDESPVRPAAAQRPILSDRVEAAPPPVQPAPQDDFQQFEDVELGIAAEAPHADVAAPPPRAAAPLFAPVPEPEVELDLPPLDDDDFSLVEETEGVGGSVNLMDVEPLPPLEQTVQPAPAATGEIPPAGLDLGMDDISLEPPEAEPLPVPPPAGPASGDLARLDADMDAADLPSLDDSDLDLGPLEMEPAAASAAPGAKDDTFDFGPLSEEPLGGPAPQPAPLDDLPLGDLELPDDFVTGKAAEPTIKMPLPAIVPEVDKGKQAPPGKEPPPRIMVPGQEGWFSERRRLLALIVVAGIIAGAILGWAGWLMRDNTERPFAFEFGKVHQLALQEDLTGRVVTNRKGQKLFVVEGQLVNRFPAGTKISWIRVRGTIYADHAQSKILGTTQVYLGNVLTQQQLETWEVSAIAAYSAYNNGRKDVNLDIPPLEVVPFQLVFPDVRAPVARTVAQVIGYTRNGLSVYLEAPVSGAK